MLIDNILNKLELNSNNSSSYYKFETFILNLLKIHLQKNNKPFIYDPRRMGFDALAPEGIEDIKGATQIEIRFNIDRRPTVLLIEQINKALVRINDINEFDNLLIITPNPISKNTKEKLYINIKKRNFPFQIIFWEPEDLNKIVAKHRKEANEIANNLFSLRIESAVTKGSKDWKKERDEKIELLKKLYKKGQFSFFLGAGVSSSAGMPDWNTLLNSLFVTYLTNEFDQEEKINDDDIFIYNY